jgi:hypothetical protein
MDYKGYCLWANDVPSSDAPHYIVITSSSDPHNMVMVVVISSIKYKSDGTEKYHDKSCLLSVDDIVDDTGKKILTKPSFIRYEYTVDMNSKTILDKQFSDTYRYKCKISDALLKRIQEGAKNSQELEPRFQKYFDFF